MSFVLSNFDLKNSFLQISTAIHLILPIIYYFQLSCCVFSHFYHLFQAPLHFIPFLLFLFSFLLLTCYDSLPALHFEILFLNFANLWNFYSVELLYSGLFYCLGIFYQPILLNFTLICSLCKCYLVYLFLLDLLSALLTLFLFVCNFVTEVIFVSMN